MPLVRHPARCVVAVILFVTCVSCLQAFGACDEVPAGKTFRIRLSEPIASYSTKTGAPVHGVVLESPECDGLPYFPRGTHVEGRVKRARKVGMGLRHETAALEIEFDWISPDGDFSR